MSIFTVPIGNHTRRVLSTRREPRSDKVLPLQMRNPLTVSFVHTCLDEIIASFFPGFQQFCHKIWHICLSWIVPAMLIHFCTARRRQSSQSLRKLCACVRVRSVICAKAAQRCRHKQSQGLLRAIRDYLPCACAASFLPVPGLACSGAGSWTSIQHTSTRRRAANSHASRPSACRPANVATTTACSVVSRAFRLERSKPLETKRRGENNRKGEFWYKKAWLIKMRQIVPGSAGG